MQKEFYSNYYFVVLSGFMTATFLYYIVEYAFIKEALGSLIVLGPFFFLSLLALIYSIYMQKKPVFIIANRLIYARQLSLKYKVFEIAVTDIKCLEDKISFSTNGEKHFFYKRLVLYNSWGEIVDELERQTGTNTPERPANQYGI